jgi:cupin superfamily acireductone dioxygenase involved in methionine salvage
MNQYYTIFSKTTGEIRVVLICSETDLPFNYDAEKESFLQQNIDGSKYYIDVVTNTLVAMPEKPNAWFDFDFTTKQWVGNEMRAKFDVNQRRKKLLLNSDWTQIPNNPLTAEQQAAYATYRQELRDIPQQSGYPFNVVFPVAPI